MGNLMKNRWIAFLLLIGLVLPSTAAFLPLYAKAEESDTAGTAETPVETVETTAVAEDTFIMTESSAKLSTSSGASEKWNKRISADYTNLTDPLDSTRTVSCLRHISTSTDATISQLVKNTLKADDDLLIAYDLLIPSDAEAEYVLAPASLSATLFGTTLLTIAADGDAWTVTLGGAAVGTCTAGAWLRVSIAYDAESQQMRLVLAGDLRDTTGAATSCFVRDAYPCAMTNTNTLTLSYIIPPSTADATAYTGFMIGACTIRNPGDMYLESAALESYEDDPMHNVRRDGTLTLTFSHDIDPMLLRLGAICLTDADGNALSYTQFYQPARAMNTLIFSFADDPLPKFTTVVVHFDAGITDLIGQPYCGDTTTSVSVYGDKGELRAKMPIVETPVGGYIMPDIYNTGYQCAYEELEPLLEKYPLLSANGTVTEGATITITDELARTYGYCFEGFRYTGALVFKCTKPLTVTNAYLNTLTQHYGIENKGSGYVTVSYLEGEGSLSAFIQGGNLKLSHIYLHDVGADHMKAASNQWLEHSYFRDGGTQNPDAHADCIQFSGSSKEVIDNIVVIGNRMDIPQLLWDHVGNSTLFFKTERNTLGITNVQMIGNWLNGGGHTSYLTIDTAGADAAANTRYITFKDNLFGYGGRWATVCFGSTYWTEGADLIDYGGAYENNERVTTLDAGSILLRDGAGTVCADLADIEGGTLQIDVNFANYLLAAREYRITVRVLAGDGQILAEKSADGSIRRYIHYDEYAAEDNLTDVTDAEGNVIQENFKLKVLPDLPANVLGGISLTGLPSDLSGCKAEIVVYDTTDGEDTLIRAETITGSGTYSPALPIMGASMRLGAEMSMRFFVNGAMRDTLPAGATLMLANDLGETYSCSEEGELLAFEVSNIAASEIGTTHSWHLQYTLGDGAETPITSSISVDYSPLEYAIRMYVKESDNETLRLLLTSMVQYADAAGSTAAKATFTAKTGYVFGEGEIGDYGAIRRRDAETVVDYDTQASTIALIGASLTGNVNLLLHFTDERYTTVQATIAGDALQVTKTGDTALVRGLYATDLYGVITFTFTGADVPTVEATYTVARFLDGYTGGTYEALARAAALYMQAAITYAEGL